MNPGEQHLQQIGKQLRETGIGDQPLILAVIAFDQLRQFGCYADEYIDLLIEAADPAATIVMNSFTWSFCETERFHHLETPSECGLASEIFRRMEGVSRSSHPLFSMTARGPMSQKVLAHTGKSCWGDGTPAEVLVAEDAFCVTIGKEFPRSLTVLHSFEEWKQVPYLGFKTYRGEADYGSGYQQVETEYYVPHTGGVRSIEYSWKPAVDVLHQRNLVRAAESNLPVRAVFARDLRDVVYELLEHDQYTFVPSLG